MLSFEDLMARFSIGDSEDAESTDVRQTLRLTMEKLSESYQCVLSQDPQRSLHAAVNGSCPSMLEVFPSSQESHEAMQGALSGGGQPAAETAPRRVSPRVGGGRTPPAAGATPPLPAAAHGQHLYSLSQGGPGESSSPGYSLRRREELITGSPLFGQMLQRLSAVSYQQVYDETRRCLQDIIETEQVGNSHCIHSRYMYVCINI